MQESPVLVGHLILGESGSCRLEITVIGHADVHVDWPPLRLGQHGIALMPCPKKGAGPRFSVDSKGWIQNSPCPICSAPDAGLADQVRLDGSQPGSVS
jgi:hypothetical protein